MSGVPSVVYPVILAVAGGGGHPPKFQSFGCWPITFLKGTWVVQYSKLVTFMPRGDVLPCVG